MPITFRLNTVRLSSGDEVSVPTGGIVVIVGPNNVGKSTALREVPATLASDTAHTVVEACEFEAGGTNEELSAWLASNFAEKPKPEQRTFEGTGVSVQERHAHADWNDGRPTQFRRTINLFCHHTTGAAQQSAATNFSSFSVLESGPTTPVQLMFVDEQLEQQMSRHFHRAFGVSLFVNRFAGNAIPVHCGDRPELAPGETPHTRSYLERIQSVPNLSQQGDGMKSFAGAMFTVCASHATLICFDEPELFLHPPQARELGRFLSTHTPTSKQILIATHNSSLIRGLLDSDTGRVSIVRLTRSADANRAHTLSHDELTQFWSDPILRYSGAIDGIFHDRVIVCESDSDCHFYSAMVSALVESRGIPEPSVLFVPCGGKHRLRTVMRALRALHVPTDAIADIDMLDDEATLRGLVEAFGADWDSLAALYTRVRTAFEHISPPQNANQVAQRIREVLDRIQTPQFTRQHEHEVRDAMRATSPWRLAKRTGISHLQGGALVDATQLLEQLAGIGLHVLRNGELERFAPTIPEHGPAWTAAALARDLTNDPELSDARQFISNLALPLT